jgi:hypothetical protein
VLAKLRQIEGVLAVRPRQLPTKKQKGKKQQPSMTMMRDRIDDIDRRIHDLPNERPVRAAVGNRSAPQVSAPLTSKPSAKRRSCARL